MFYITFIDYEFQIHKNELDAINYLLGENFLETELGAARDLYEENLLDGTIEFDYLIVNKKTKNGIILQLPTELVFFEPNQKEKLTNYLINSYSEIAPDKYSYNEWKEKIQALSEKSQTINDFVKRIESTDITENNLTFQNLNKLLQKTNQNIKSKKL